LFLSIDRSNWTSEIFSATRLYFNKNKRIAIATDDVDLTSAPWAKITVKNFITVLAQETGGESFATDAALKMLR
jgi:hypothetical protein